MKPLQYKKNIIRGQCAVKNCKRNTHGRTLCSGHRAAKHRLADPVKYAYDALRHNAKRRNILFTITLDQFRDWCSKVTYIGFAGRSSESYTIDRRHNDIGYHIDNIAVMEKGKNVKKYFYYDYRVKSVAFVKAEQEVLTDQPF